MPFSTDGVYTIRNVGRDLLLDLRDFHTTEGNTIQVWHNNSSVAQQWVVKQQYGPVSSNKTVTIQSSINGSNGNGFFAAATQDSDEPVVYTRQAFIVDLVPREDDTYTISYTLGDPNLVISIPSATHYEAKLENHVSGTSRQQWEFTRVADLQPVV
ncbi:uncharacterized protein F5891DRAFT_1273338 [Suillus fuscotomentosus]|uniref:Ricin B lectin domain-containing protein n=1 Tax=Suillus fuscotomentosus TaxID=1912939 RepID=A0AAD4EML8_9AGAM|nr:uncharacterized protein F5891DRAFT_1273338 [Suillus fuscotomentosus]KAG1908885.1 hypothetical protein F5891DRAFT_1273338 [Suillus fuscotomentosus]